MPKKEIVDIEAELKAETKKAFLINDGKIECWVPKSQVERDKKIFTMPVWLATEKGFV